MDEITTGELSRRLERLEMWTHSFESKVDRQYTLLQTSIATLGFVSKDVYEANLKSIREEMDGIKRIAMWALGAIVSVVIGAVLVSIIGLGGVFK